MQGRNGVERMKHDNHLNKLVASVSKKSFELSVESDSKGIAANLWIAHGLGIRIAKFIIGIIVVPIIIHLFQIYFTN
jgi:hypothetical protein